MFKVNVLLLLGMSLVCPVFNYIDIELLVTSSSADICLNMPLTINQQ